MRQNLYERTRLRPWGNEYPCQVWKWSVKNYGRECVNGACLPCRPPHRPTACPLAQATTIPGALKAQSHRALPCLRLNHGRQKVVSHEADHVARVDVEYSRFIDVAGGGGNWNSVGRVKKVWTAQNFSLQTTTSGTRCKDVNVKHTW